MPKVPRDCSHDKLVKFLRSHGWNVSREGRRHTLLSNGFAQLTVPRHDRLKTGTVKAILDQAGIAVEMAAREL